MTINETAAAAITAAGFTPCKHSAFETHRGAFCFSQELATGRSMEGVAATGYAIRLLESRHEVAD